eukprot:2792371-Rhodomonas_salina.1
MKNGKWGVLHSNRSRALRGCSAWPMVLTVQVRILEQDFSPKLNLVRGNHDIKSSWTIEGCYPTQQLAESFPASTYLVSTQRGRAGGVVLEPET